MTLSNHISSYVRRIRSGTREDPVRDWLVLFTLAIVAFVCIVVWNIWAFDTVAQGGSISTAAPSAPAVFNRSSLDTINSVFTMRGVEESKYVTGVYRYTDPSQ